jgi:hypothetical protein
MGMDLERGYHGIGSTSSIGLDEVLIREMEDVQIPLN